MNDRFGGLMCDIG